MIPIDAIAEFAPTVTIREAIKPESDGVYGIVQARDVGRDGRLEISGVARVKSLPGGTLPLLQVGDVVLQSRGTSFRAAAVSENDEQLVASGGVYVLRPDRSRVDPGFLVFALNLPATQSALRQIATGTYIPNIRRDALASFKIALPSLQRQRLIAELGAEIFRVFEIEQRLFDLRLQQLHALINEGGKNAGDVAASPASKRSVRRLRRRQAMS
jgi:hypothetical protein